MARYTLSTTRRGTRFGPYNSFKTAVRASGAGVNTSLSANVVRTVPPTSAKTLTLISAPNAGYIGDTLAP